MKPLDFQNLYRETYGKLGFPITDNDGFSEIEITAAENACGLKLPKSLRDYYLIAGREKKLNNAFNRLLSPNEWEIRSGKLVFMTENQCVVLWGTDLNTAEVADSKVFQGSMVKREVREWFGEHESCSDFLVFMLHLQAAYGGGMKFTSSAKAPAEIVNFLDGNWNFAGEVQKMRAYNKSNRAVCFTKWRDFFSKTETWRIFAGANSKMELDSIASDLQLQWD